MYKIIDRTFTILKLCIKIIKGTKLIIIQVKTQVKLGHIFIKVSMLTFLQLQFLHQELQEFQEKGP